MRKAEIDQLLTAMLDSHQNVSDLNITVNRPLQVEASGSLVPVPVQPMIEHLTPFQTEIFALNLVGADRRLCTQLLEQGSCDASYQLQQKARFRVNIFSQRANYSLVLRKLETRIPTMADLNLPVAFSHMPAEKNGLILVTGATGSGKSTSLAALINEINQQKALHIVTLEDPIEFVHPNLCSTVNQRELGTDYDSFASGLRAALRQAPKIILVGEMRDRETVELGLKAAETGHLVLSTLHTVDAGQAIGRIVGMFDQEEEKQVRMRLADTLRWIVSQRLLPRVGGGRIAVHDILRNGARTKESIQMGEAEGKTFYEIQEQGRATYHMQTYDQAISQAYVDGQVTEETAVAYATRKAIVMRAIDRIKQERGEKTTDIENIGLDQDYNRQLKRQ
ncbi:type IV pilus twitching motility protein PilT [Gemmatimonas sp.]|jgi:twitching motility protein PilT|uniref:type IV pilus twitching motility protein PilT n=1 Tax=Gemmatimonas sp. TaxID=1962908 RepID=UPI0037C03306